MNLDIQQVTVTCQEAAVNAVEELSEEDLAAGSVTRLTERIVADKVARPIQLDTVNHAYTSEIVTIPAQQGLAYSGIIMPSAVRPAARGVQLSLHIPYTGTRQAFIYRPSTRRSEPPEAVISDREVILTVTDTGTDAALAEQRLLGQEQNLLAWVELINADIDRLAPPGTCSGNQPAQ
jgi:hypothetical protein